MMNVTRQPSNMQALMDSRRLKNTGGVSNSDYLYLAHQKMINSTKNDFLHEKAHEKKTL